MKQLIINADDFGLHPLINQGIIKGYREGMITSTTLMTSAPAWEEAVELARANSGLGVGIHLTLVGSVPPVLRRTAVSSLLDADGLFPADYVGFAKRFYTGGIKNAELEAELRAQIERALATGLTITHLDSHQHTHVLPGLNKLVIKLANEYNIKRMRMPYEAYGFSGGYEVGIGRKIGRAGLSFCAQMASWQMDAAGVQHPQAFFGMLAGGHLNAQLVHNILQALPDGVSELMTHPGFDSAELGKVFSWQYHWRDELDAYLSEANKEFVEKEKIELINFGGLV